MSIIVCWILLPFKTCSIFYFPTFKRLGNQGISPGLAQAATIIAEMSPGGDLEGDVPYLILAFFGCLFPYQH